MLKLFYLGSLLLGTAFWSCGFAATFKDVVKSIEAHHSVKVMESQSGQILEQGKVEGSWGDPMIKAAAKNFPKSSLKDNETPMTGLELGISQKIALSTKYGNIQDSFELKSQAKQDGAEDQKRGLTKAFWEFLIKKRKLEDKEKIFSENRSWISKMLRITKKLYANGKVTQQALLELQIRKSELDSELESIKHELKKISFQITYLAGSKIEKISKESIPWAVLNTEDPAKRDFKEMKFSKLEQSTQKSLTAAKLNYIPDVTVAAGYTKRANIDNRGDFVGLTLSFPLPFSGKKYANHSGQVHQHYAAKKALKNYQDKKSSVISVLETEIIKIKSELDILEKRTLKYAINSKVITSKSYGLGNSSYIELLQSELKLQSLQLKRLHLVEKRDLGRVQLKYIRGDRLYEN